MTGLKMNFSHTFNGQGMCVYRCLAVCLSSTLLISNCVDAVGNICPAGGTWTGGGFESVDEILPLLFRTVSEH